MADQECTSKQIAEVLRLLFTKAYLAYSHFQNYNTKHITFKMNLANELMSYRMEQCFPLSLSTDNIAAADISDTKVCALVLLKNHQLEKMDARGHFKDIRNYSPKEKPGKKRSSYH